MYKRRKRNHVSQLIINLEANGNYGIAMPPIRERKGPKPNKRGKG